MYVMPQSKTAARRPNVEHLGETGPLSQGVQEGRKALRILYIHGMEVRKKKPRRFKKKSRGFR